MGILGASDAYGEMLGLLGTFEYDLHVPEMKRLEPPDDQ